MKKPLTILAALTFSCGILLAQEAAPQTIPDQPDQSQTDQPIPNDQQPVPPDQTAPSQPTDVAPQNEQPVEPQPEIQKPEQAPPEIRNDPAGAERRKQPRSRPFPTNQPPRRAFDETNPPQGRPFQEGELPPGRPFREGQQPGTPTATPGSNETPRSDAGANEPAGAIRPDANPDKQDDALKSNDLRAPGTQQIQEPAGAQNPSPGKQSSQQDISGKDSDQQPSSTNPTRPEEQKSSDQSKGEAGEEIDEPAGAQRVTAEQLAQALGTQTTVGVDQKSRIRQVLTASIEGNNVPAEFVDRLATDLSMAKMQLSEETRTRLANALNTVLAAHSSQQKQIEQALSTVQSLLIESGATRSTARAVAYDLQLIATELVPDLRLSVPVPAVR
jgi:hypothetical protein